MKRYLLGIGLSLLLLSPLGGCEKNNDTTAPEDPGQDETGAVPDSLALARTFPAVLADGLGEVTIVGTVVDALGRGLAGVGVAFQTDHGTITPFGTTDAAGHATATLVSEASATDLVAQVVASASTATLPNGMRQAVVLVSRNKLSSDLQAKAARDAHAGARAAVAALVGSIHDTARIPMTGLTVSVAATPSTIPADGMTASRVVATVIETTRRIPLDGREVRFGATSGSITGRVMTNSEGAAIASFTGAPGETNATVTAYFGQTLTAQASVSFSALAMSLETESAALAADGFSSTGVIARLVNENGNPVVGARVDFSTTMGTISSPVVTDDRGEARAVLIAASSTGTATIVARFGASLSQSATVAFVSPPTTARVLLRVEPGVLPADRASEARLTATALDGQSNPMPDGTPVTFTISDGVGRIVGPVRLTSGGVAEGVYVAGGEVGSVTFQATSGASSATTNLVLEPLPVGNIELSADRASILADGSASSLVTAAVTDRFGQSVLPGTVVQFTSSDGILSEARPTDETGTASVRLRAVRFKTGTARIVATSGDVQRTVDVKLVSEAAAHVEAITVDHPRLGVLGASDHETCTITFEAQDRNGIPVDSDHGVSLTFSIAPEGEETDATVYPASATTDDNGRVLATVNAGIISGAVKVHAAGSGLLSQPIRVAIHGDLPDLEHFSVFSEKLNVAGRVYGLLRYEVCAKVGDHHGNPVPDSTAVWFSATHGIIQGSGFTGSVGDACVTAETAGPFPDENGFVTVTAQTVSKEDQLIETSTRVLWSGPTVVEITNPGSGFDVPNGGAIAIDFTVSDDLDNPLVAGTSIKVTSTGGSLGGDTDVVLADTQSRDYTRFHVILTDDDPETDEAAAVTVSVKVSSENGNRSALVTGTKH